MKERAVYLWQKRGSEFMPGGLESVRQIIARLEDMLPYDFDRVVEFSRSLQQEVRSYYPDHPELMALYGDLEKQAADCRSGLFRIGFPVRDADIALKLILRNSPYSFVVFLAESGQTFEASSLVLNLPSFQRWLSSRQQLPASLDDLRKRVADVMSDVLKGSGFVFSKRDGGARFVRKTEGGVEQEIIFYLRKLHDNPHISIYVKLRCDDLLTVQKVSRIDFREEISLNWGRLLGVDFRQEERLYVWDDILERAGFIERSLLHVLDGLSSLKAIDALLCRRESPHLNIHLVPYAMSRLVAARLVANPDYDQLRVETVRAYEARVSPDGVERLHKLIAFLDGLSPGTMPVVEDDVSVPCFEKNEMLACAEKLIREHLRDLKLRKRDPGRTMYSLVLARTSGDLLQYVYFTFRRHDGVWGVHVGVGFRDSAVWEISKAIHHYAGQLGGFRWHLFGKRFDDYFSFATWSEFVAYLEECGKQIRLLMQGIDSISAIQAAFYQLDSSRYSDAMFDSNKFEAYVVGRLLGGDDGKDVVVRAISRIKGVEGEGARSQAEHELFRVDNALKKVAGLQPVAGELA